MACVPSNVMSIIHREMEMDSVSYMTFTYSVSEWPNFHVPASIKDCISIHSMDSATLHPQIVESTWSSWPICPAEACDNHAETHTVGEFIECLSHVFFDTA